MLKRFPGPGVQAVRPLLSSSQKLLRLLALPGNLQLMPIMAIGSGCPLAESPPAVKRPQEVHDGELDLSVVMSISGLCVTFPLGGEEVMVIVRVVRRIRI
jgi:hypothetical protein